MESLNSPIEVGLRGLVLLAVSEGRLFDLDHLALMDHYLIHSGDVGGPPSIHPAVPIRLSEFGVKSQILEQGLAVLCRAGRVEAHSTSSGICYRSREDASIFLSLFRSQHIQRLLSVAPWVIEAIGDLDQNQVSARYLELWETWNEASAPEESSGKGGQQ